MRTQAKPGIDRDAAARVSSFVPRLTAVLAATLLAVTPACGPKNKGSQGPTEDGTTGMTGGDPDGSGSVTGSGPGSGDQRGGGGPDSPGGDLPGTGEGEGGEGEEGEPERPKVEPPVADISEQEAKQQAAGHIKAAEAALKGSSRDPDRAIKAAKDALAIDPNSVQAVVLLAHAYYFKKLYSTADVLLLRAINSPNKKIANVAGRSADVYYLRGLIHDAMEKPDAAKLLYERAYQLDPKHAGTFMNLVMHRIKESRYAEAQAMYETLIRELGVNTAPAWTNLGSAYRGRSISASLSADNRRKLLLAAEEDYKRAISLDKNYAPAYYNLGLLYMDAQPFPLGNNDMDELVRLERAKTYFDEYRALPGADINLVDEQIRNVDRAIKKEKKRRTKKDDDW